jgi:hypothetical protein
MLNLDKYKSEIESIISSLNAKDYTIELVPGAITNDGKLVDVIQVLIEHTATKKTADYLYRHGYHDLKQFLQMCVADFEKQIVKDVLNQKDKKSL